MSNEEVHVARAIEDALRTHGSGNIVLVARAAIKAIEDYRKGHSHSPTGLEYRFPPVTPVVKDESKAKR